MKRFDVVAVNLDTHEERLIAADKDEKNAEAIVEMCVIRRGVEEEFYKAVPARVWAGVKS